MRQNNRQTGTAYEKKAEAYLREQGYEIITCNFCCRRGEIDIIARDKEYLVFCEVKYRSIEDAGHPLEAVTLEKQRRISKCAIYYMETHQLQDVPCRFDVVGILGEEAVLIQNAFDFVM